MAQVPVRPTIPPTHADGCRPKFLAMIRDRQSIVVEGQTGSGKSTQIPKWLLDNQLGQRRNGVFKVVVTQPRRIAAINLAKRVTYELGYEERDMGSLLSNCPIGFKVGRLQKYNPRKTLVTFVTTGVLIQEVRQSNFNIRSYSHIIIDEVHERDIMMDVLLIMLKIIIMDQFSSSHLKVLLMSATMDTSKLLQYFPPPPTVPLDSLTPAEEAVPAQNSEVKVLNGSVHFRIIPPNRTSPHPIHIEFNQRYMPLPTGNPGASQSMYGFAKRTIQSFGVNENPANANGAVLVFLPGILEINNFQAQLEQDKIEYGRNWEILIVHGNMDREEQQLIYSPYPGMRKIILSTNVCESSITVPDVIHVIDFALCRNMVHDPITNINRLQLEWACQDQCIQRRGRVGRVRSGSYYNCLSHQVFDSLSHHKPAEMLRVGLANPILHLKYFRPLRTPEDVLAIALEPPPIQHVIAGVTNLKMLGVFTHAHVGGDGELTTFGRLIANIPIDPRLGKLVYVGFLLGVLDECIIIASCFDCQYYPIILPSNSQARIDQYVNLLALDGGDFSDHLLILKIYNTLKNFREIDMMMSKATWIRRHGINQKVFNMATEKIDQIKKRLEKANLMGGYRRMNVNYTAKQRDLMIKCAVAAAFLPLGFESYYGVGTAEPELFKWENGPDGQLVKVFYDLSRTLTYHKVPFQSWTEDRVVHQGNEQRTVQVQVTNEEMIRHQMELFFEETGSPAERIDMVVAEKKINVVFPQCGGKYLKFFLPVYKYHRYQQLKMGNIAIMEPSAHPDEEYVDPDDPRFDPAKYKPKYPLYWSGEATGPHNPLELKFRYMVNEPPCPNVRLEGNSVCAALFDPNFDANPCMNRARPFLLIGTDLKIQQIPVDQEQEQMGRPQREKTLITNGNTLYYECEGQLELMLLIFGPRIQLFSDRPLSYDELVVEFKRKNNIPLVGTGLMPSSSGILELPIGLKGFVVGTGTVEGRPFDIRYNCTFEITYGDLMKIQKIRHEMNRYSMPVANPDHIYGLRDQIMSLLGKSRARVLQPYNLNLGWAIPAAGPGTTDDYPFYPL